MNANIIAALVIIGVSGLAALLLGKRLTSWLFELYYHGKLTSRQKFFEAYDRFTDRSTFELLSMLSFTKSTMPKNYEDYLQFHEENRQKAYLLYSKHLLEKALYSSIILLACFIIPAALAQSHHWFYFTFPAIITLQVIYEKFVHRKKGSIFMHGTMLGIIVGMSIRR